MPVRLSKAGAGILAVAALALGGAALASAAGGSHAGASNASRPHAARSHAVARAQHARARVRASREDPSASEQQDEHGSTAEFDSDAAAQAAACQKSGIDPNADNVQYDDQTGTCSLDTGGGSNTGP
ncbi:MAG TPA: hypothetical protein VFA88_04785 [Gaiellaceae bacterium]|nr:hypothetical protein [Gaiellaceae bacterium]